MESHFLEGRDAPQEAPSTQQEARVVMVPTCALVGTLTRSK